MAERFWICIMWSKDLIQLLRCQVIQYLLVPACVAIMDDQWGWSCNFINACHLGDYLVSFVARHHEFWNRVAMPLGITHTSVACDMAVEDKTFQCWESLLNAALLIASQVVFCRKQVCFECYFCANLIFFFHHSSEDIYCLISDIWKIAFSISLL